MSAPDPELEYYTLAEAAALIPSAKITARSLRTEYDKGNLEVTWMAGKILVTLKAIKESSLFHEIVRTLFVWPSSTKD